MNRGAVEQLGTPQQIYGTPRTGYVADFVGAANRLTARISPAAGGMVTAELCGERILATDARHTGGPEGILILRPENLHLSRDPQPGRQSLPATIRSRQYLGAKTSYRLELPGALQVVVDLHGPGHDGFRPGDRVNMGIEPDQARVIAA